MASLARKLKKFWYRDYFSAKPRLYRRVGLLWLLRYSNYIDRKLILGTLYEARQLQYVLAFARGNNVQAFVDVGANIGLYSLYLASRAPSLETILALEPDVDNYQQLCANIFLNRLGGRVRALNLGASDQQGTVSFLKNDGNSTGTSRIVANESSEATPARFQRTEISVAPLDQLLAETCGQRMILKVDVEGHEEKVLKGMHEVLQNNACLIQMEILYSGEQRQEKIRSLEHAFGLTFLHKIEKDCYFINAAAQFDLPPIPAEIKSRR